MKNLSVILLMAFFNPMPLYVISQCGNPQSNGTSNNLYTSLNNASNPVAVDMNQNMVVFIHRSNSGTFGGNSGNLRYDLSIDGGSTWTNDLGVLNPIGTYSGRYPNIAIHVPSIPTPTNSYIGYLAPTFNQTIGIWSAPVTGVGKLDGTGNTEKYNQTFPTYFLPATSLVKGDFGKFWSIAPSTNNGLNFNGDIKIYSGTWTATNNIIWGINNTFSIPVTLVNGSGHIGDCNIGFAPNGYTGWFCVMAHLITGPATKNFYPIFYKTVDGGATWLGPIPVDMSNLSCITASIEPGSIPGTTYSSDLSVDVYGDPHLLTAVGNCNNTYSYTIDYSKWHHMFDITQKDGMWTAYDVANVNAAPVSYTGSTAAVTIMDMCPQITRTEDGTKIFFGWLDNSTYTLGVTNINPNFFSRGFDVQQNKWTTLKDFSSCSNATNGKILFPHLATEVLEPNAGKFKLAPVYAQYSFPFDPDVTTSFKFLDSCIFQGGDFLINQPVVPVSIVQGNSFVLCAGSTLTLQLNGSFSQIAWPGGNSSTTGSITGQGTFYVMAESGCNFGSASLSVKTLTMNTNHKSVILCAGETTSLSVVGNAYSYTWMPGSATATSVIISPTVTTAYSVIANGDQNCTSKAVVNVQVSACTGIDPLTKEKQFLRAYPNPITEL